MITDWKKPILGVGVIILLTQLLKGKVFAEVSKNDVLTKVQSSILKTNATTPNIIQNKEVSTNFTENKSKLPTETKLVPSTKTIRKLKISADYRIPLYSISNRDIVDTITQQMTSMGLSFNDIKQIDLGKIPADAWAKMGFDILYNTLLTAAAGPVGGIVALLPTIISYVMTIKSKTPEQKLQKAFEKFQSFQKKHIIFPKDGMFLGTLAKNRIGSHLIPLIKIYNDELSDQTYATPSILPIFLETGYHTDGRAMGYVSKIPFKNSILIKLLYSLVYTDFVVVVDGSEFERILLNNDYFPVVELGYISRILQKGQTGIINVDLENLETVQTLTTSGIDFVLKYQNPEVSYYHRLNPDIALPSDGRSSIIHKDINISPKAYPAQRTASTINGMRVYSLGTTITQLPLGIEGLKIPVTPELLTKYKGSFRRTFYLPLQGQIRPRTYHGLLIPPQGAVSSIYYRNGYKTLLVHLVDDTVIEVRLGTNLNSFDILSVLSILKSLAMAPRSKYAFRLILGNFLKIENSLPIYIIDSLDTLMAQFIRYNKRRSIFNKIYYKYNISGSSKNTTEVIRSYEL